MRIVNFKGGLGNQMFQYAFLLSLKEKYKEELILMDTSAYKIEKMHNGFELTRRFEIPEREASEEELKPFRTHISKGWLYRCRLKTIGPSNGVFLEKDFSTFCPNLKERDFVYYDGYWQCHMYFDEIADRVKETYRFSDELDNRNKSVLNDINSSRNSVGIHVRRGDYLQTPLYKGICDVDYYVKAIDVVREKLMVTSLKVFIFSNDINWCFANLSSALYNADIHFVDFNKGEDSYKDMILMSSCHHNIIANSSFSWWSAYLNCNKDNIVVAPQRWINHEMQYKIQLDNWIII
ncbi:MAG: alpha-1,2-fucosyltransferase [Aeriscardovia sp.]|nr:alpha-1,2-fucosyltransferase [Aeriscardovia sp.]